MMSADLSGGTLAMLVLGLAVAFAVLLAARGLYGAALRVKSAGELAEKDNFAFGIGLAGTALGAAVMLSGAVEGGYAATLGEEAAVVAAYAALGLVLMWLARLVFDRVALPALSVGGEIRAGNAPVAIVDAGNVVATAVMVRAVMLWSDGGLGAAAVAVLCGFVAVQVILAAAARYRVWLFSRRNAGRRFGEAVRGGNVALALRFAGFQMGTALAAAAAAQVVVYDPGGGPVGQALLWGLCSAVLAAVLAALAFAAERVVLRGIDVAEEVDRQGNVGVALAEAALYVGIGLLLNGLLA